MVRFRVESVMFLVTKCKLNQAVETFFIIVSEITFFPLKTTIVKFLIISIIKYFLYFAIAFSQVIF